MGFEDPLEALQACHGRIEEHLQALERLAHRASAGAAESTVAQAVLDYFETSGAHHHRDEDEDLFPLLRSRAAQLGRIEVAAGIDEIEREHATLDAQWRRLREALRTIAAGSAARLDAGEAGRFAWLYRRHMDRESQLVLPFARENLSFADCAAHGGAARREVVLCGLWPSPS
jgi:hemerythrin-like domain-containing protein